MPPYFNFSNFKLVGGFLQMLRNCWISVLACSPLFSVQCIKSHNSFSKFFWCINYSPCYGYRLVKINSKLLQEHLTKQKRNIQIHGNVINCHITLTFVKLISARARLGTKGERKNKMVAHELRFLSRTCNPEGKPMKVIKTTTAQFKQTHSYTRLGIRKPEITSMRVSDFTRVNKPLNWEEFRAPTIQEIQVITKCLSFPISIWHAIRRTLLGNLTKSTASTINYANGPEQEPPWFSS